MATSLIPVSVLLMASGSTVAMDLCGVGREPSVLEGPACPLGRIANTALVPTKCQDPGSVPQYGACSEPRLCQSGLVCDQAEEVCLPPVAPGDACVDDVDCGLMWCNYGYSKPQCQPAGDLDAICASKKDCQPHLRCIQLRCTP